MRFPVPLSVSICVSIIALTVSVSVSVADCVLELPERIRLEERASVAKRSQRYCIGRAGDRHHDDM